MIGICRTVFRLALLYAFTSILGLAIFIVLHRSMLFAETAILFYRGLALSIVAALVLAAGIGFVARSRINLAAALGCVITSLSLNLCFLVLIPVTVDRSISVFLLTRIENDNGKITEPELEKNFREQYLGRMRQIDRRIGEQSASGNITIDKDGKIRMTPQGRAFLRFSRTIAATFQTDPRFVTPDHANAH